MSNRKRQTVNESEKQRAKKKEISTCQSYQSIRLRQTQKNPREIERKEEKRKKCQKIFLMVFYRVQHTPTSYNVGRRFAVKLRWILWSIHATYSMSVWPKMSKSKNVRFNLEIDFSFFFYNS